jgi:CDP-diacylglycerol--glycerol-3-phosphate 3-phosphatidyltransferase
MFGAQVQRQARQIAEQAVRPIAALPISPNTISLIGLALSGATAGVIALGPLRFGGVCLLLASIFDMFDGAVARVQQKSSVFGAFLDSTLDRYAEGALLLGVIIHAMRAERAGPTLTWIVALAFAAAMLSLIVSYTRARAEGLGLDCKVGLMERPERVILLGCGLLLGGDAWLVWVLAVLVVTTGFTGLQRILHVYRVSSAQSLARRRDQSPAARSLSASDLPATPSR